MYLTFFPNVVLPLSKQQLPLDCQQTALHREGLLKSNRSSRSSDTSSAYSGSDTMQSVQSSLEDNEVDFTGLVESAVDSDEEEDLAESIDVSGSGHCLFFFFDRMYLNIFQREITDVQ